MASQSDGWEDTIMRVGDRVLPTDDRIQHDGMPDDVSFRIHTITGTQITLRDEYDDTLLIVQRHELTHDPEFPLAKWIVS